MKRYHNALLCIFILSVGLLISIIPCYATTPFISDNFDSYDIGSINGQGKWINGSGTMYISDEFSESEPNSIISPLSNVYVYYTNNEYTQNEGKLFFSFYKETASYESVNIEITEDNNPLYAMAYFSCRVGYFCAFNGGGGGISPAPTAGQWERVGIEWNGTQTRFYHNEYVSEWKNYLDGSTGGKVNRVKLGASTVFNFDNFSDSITLAPTIIEGYAPILRPQSPERNAEIIVDFDAGFEVSGRVEIPTDNPHTYNNLTITFRKPEAFFPAKTINIDIGDLVGGQSYEYSATTTIPITESGTNFYKVGYTLTGSTYAGSSANNPPISTEMLAFDNTWVKDSANGAPAYLITPSIKPTQDAMENCGEYSGIEAVLCGLRNFIVGAFLPSDDAINQIGGTMAALENKFPMNYAGAVVNSFSTISAGVNDDAGFSISLMGHNGSVDTSFFIQDIGGGATLGGIVKLALTFLVLFGFLIWGINYMHRILMH